MTNKENILAALTGKQPESVVHYASGVQSIFPILNNESPSLKEGKPGFDAWGVHQTPTASGGGFFTPTPGAPPVLEDVTDWKQLKIPDFSQGDWERFSKMEHQIFNIDRENHLLAIGSNNGMFERMQSLMGFENTLVALMTEPEACFELAGAIADTKIQVIRQAAKYYKPDIFTLFDDYSHKDGLFMSPDLWREIFKPHFIRIIQACHEEGILFEQHCCGRFEELLPDFMECGIDMLDPVQPVNNIQEMKKLTLGKIGLIGGLDVQNVTDRPGVTEEEIRSECRRCIDEYAAGGGYVVFGAAITANMECAGGRTKMEVMIDECSKYGKNWYAK